MTFKTIPAGTVTEHLLAWDGEDSSLPEWTADLEVEDARVDEGTRKLQLVFLGDE